MVNKFKLAKSNTDPQTNYLQSDKAIPRVAAYVPEQSATVSSQSRFTIDGVGEARGVFYFKQLADGKIQLCYRDRSNGDDQPLEYDAASGSYTLPNSEEKLNVASVKALMPAGATLVNNAAPPENIDLANISSLEALPKVPTSRTDIGNLTVAERVGDQETPFQGEIKEGVPFKRSVKANADADATENVCVIKNSKLFAAVDGAWVELPDDDRAAVDLAPAGRLAGTINIDLAKDPFISLPEIPQGHARDNLQVIHRADNGTETGYPKEGVPFKRRIGTQAADGAKIYVIKNGILFQVNDNGQWQEVPDDAANGADRNGVAGRQNDAVRMHEDERFKDPVRDGDLAKLDLDGTLLKVAKPGTLPELPSMNNTINVVIGDKTYRIKRVNKSVNAVSLDGRPDEHYTIEYADYDANGNATYHQLKPVEGNGDLFQAVVPKPGGTDDVSVTIGTASLRRFLRESKAGKTYERSEQPLAPQLTLNKNGVLVAPQGGFSLVTNGNKIYDSGVVLPNGKVADLDIYTDGAGLNADDIEAIPINGRDYFVLKTHIRTLKEHGLNRDSLESFVSRIDSINQGGEGVKELADKYTDKPFRRIINGEYKGTFVVRKGVVFKLSNAGAWQQVQAGTDPGRVMGADVAIDLTDPKWHDLPPQPDFDPDKVLKVGNIADLENKRVPDGVPFERIHDGRGDIRYVYILKDGQLFVQKDKQWLPVPQGDAEVTPPHGLPGRDHATVGINTGQAPFNGGNLPPVPPGRLPSNRDVVVGLDDGAVRNGPIKEGVPFQRLVQYNGNGILNGGPNLGYRICVIKGGELYVKDDKVWKLVPNGDQLDERQHRSINIDLADPRFAPAAGMEHAAGVEASVGADEEIAGARIAPRISQLPARRKERAPLSAGELRTGMTQTGKKHAEVELIDLPDEDAPLTELPFKRKDGLRLNLNEPFILSHNGHEKECHLEVRHKGGENKFYLVTASGAYPIPNNPAQAEVLRDFFGSGQHLTLDARYCAALYNENLDFGKAFTSPLMKVKGSTHTNVIEDVANAYAQADDAGHDMDAADAEALAMVCYLKAGGNNVQGRAKFLREFLVKCSEQKPRPDQERLKGFLEKLCEVRGSDGELLFGPEVLNYKYDEKNFRDFILSPANSNFMSSLLEASFMQNVAQGTADQRLVTQVAKTGIKADKLVAETIKKSNESASRNSKLLAQLVAEDFNYLDEKAREGQEEPKKGIFPSANEVQKFDYVADLIVNILAIETNNITDETCKDVIKTLADECGAIRNILTSPPDRANLASKLEEKFAKHPKLKEATLPMLTALSSGVQLQGGGEITARTERLEKQIADFDTESVKEPKDYSKLQGLVDSYSRKDDFELFLDHLINHKDDVLKDIISAEASADNPTLKPKLINRLCLHPKGREFLRDVVAENPNASIGDILGTAPNFQASSPPSKQKDIRTLLIKAGVFDSSVLAEVESKKLGFWYEGAYGEFRATKEADNADTKVLTNLDEATMRAGVAFSLVDKIFKDAAGDEERINDDLISLFDVNITDKDEAGRFQTVVNKFAEIISADSRFEGVDLTRFNEKLEEKIKGLKPGSSTDLEIADQKVKQALDGLKRQVAELQKKLKTPFDQSFEQIEDVQSLVLNFFEVGGDYTDGTAANIEQLFDNEYDLDTIFKNFDHAIERSKNIARNISTEPFNRGRIGDMLNRFAETVVSEDGKERFQMAALYHYCLGKGPDSEFGIAAKQFRDKCYDALKSAQGQGLEVENYPAMALVAHSGVFRQTKNQFEFEKHLSDFKDHVELTLGEEEEKRKVEIITKDLRGIFSEYGKVPDGGNRVLGIEELVSFIEKLPQNIKDNRAITALILQEAIKSDKLKESDFKKLLEIEHIKEQITEEGALSYSSSDVEHELISVGQYLTKYAGIAEDSKLLAVFKVNNLTASDREKLHQASGEFQRYPTQDPRNEESREEDKKLLKKAYSSLMDGCNSAADFDTRLAMLRDPNSEFYAGQFFEVEENVRDFMLYVIKEQGGSKLNFLLQNDLFKENAQKTVKSPLYKDEIERKYDALREREKKEYKTDLSILGKHDLVGQQYWRNSRYVDPRVDEEDTKHPSLLLKEQLRNLDILKDVEEAIDLQVECPDNIEQDAIKDAVAIITKGMNKQEGGEAFDARRDPKFRDGLGYNYDEFLDKLHKQWSIKDTTIKDGDGAGWRAGKKKRDYIRTHKPQVLATALAERELALKGGDKDAELSEEQRQQMARIVYSMVMNVALDPSEYTNEDLQSLLATPIVKRYANEKIPVYTGANSSKDLTLRSALEQMTEYPGNDSKQCLAGKFWSNKRWLTGSTRGYWTSQRANYVDGIRERVAEAIVGLGDDALSVKTQDIVAEFEALGRDSANLKKSVGQLFAQAMVSSAKPGDIVAAIKQIGESQFTVMDFQAIIEHLLADGNSFVNKIDALYSEFPELVKAALDEPRAGTNTLREQIQSEAETRGSKAQRDEYKRLFTIISGEPKSPDGRPSGLKSGDLYTHLSHAERVSKDPKAKALRRLLEQAANMGVQSEGVKFVQEAIANNDGELSQYTGLDATELDRLLLGIKSRQMSLDEAALFAVKNLSLPLGRGATTDVKRTDSQVLEALENASLEKKMARLAVQMQGLTKGSAEYSAVVEETKKLAKQEGYPEDDFAQVLQDMQEAGQVLTEQDFADRARAYLESGGEKFGDPVDRDINRLKNALTFGSHQDVLDSMRNFSAQTKDTLRQAAQLIKDDAPLDGETGNKFLDDKIMRILLSPFSKDEKVEFLKTMVGTEPEVKQGVLDEFRGQPDVKRHKEEIRKGLGRYSEDGAYYETQRSVIALNGKEYTVDDESVWLASYICDQGGSGNVGGLFRPEILAIGFRFHRDLETRLAARVAGGKESVNEDYWMQQRMALAADLCQEYGIPDLTKEIAELENEEDRQKFIENFGKGWPAEQKAVAKSVLYATLFNSFHESHYKTNKDASLREELEFARRATNGFAGGAIFSSLLDSEDAVNIGVFNSRRFQFNKDLVSGAKPADDSTEAQNKRMYAVLGTKKATNWAHDNKERAAQMEMARKRQLAEQKRRSGLTTDDGTGGRKGQGGPGQGGPGQGGPGQGEAGQGAPGQGGPEDDAMEKMGGPDGNETPTIEQWTKLFESANARHTDLIKTYSAQMADMTAAYLADKREQSGGGIIQNLSIGGSAAILAACIVPPNPIGLAFAGTYLLMNSGAISKALASLPIVSWVVRSLGFGEQTAEDRARETLEPLLLEVKKAAAQADRFERMIMGTVEPQERSFEQDNLVPFWESRTFLNDIANAQIFPPSEMRDPRGGYRAASYNQDYEVSDQDQKVAKDCARFGLIQDDGSIITRDMPMPTIYKDNGWDKSNPLNWGSSKGWLTRDGSRVRLREVSGQCIVERKPVGGEWSSNLGPYTGMVAQGILPANAEHIQDAVIANRTSHFWTARVETVPQNPQFDDAKIREESQGMGAQRVHGGAGTSPVYGTIMMTNRQNGPNGAGLTTEEMQGLKDIAKTGDQLNRKLANAALQQHGETHGGLPLPDRESGMGGRG